MMGEDQDQVQMGVYGKIAVYLPNIRKCSKDQRIAVTGWSTRRPAGLQESSSAGAWVTSTPTSSG